MEQTAPTRHLYPSMPEPPRAPRPVNVSHDRRHVALVPSLLGCLAAFACALSSLLEGAGADLPQLAERMHAAVGLVVLGAIFTAVALVVLPRPRRHHGRVSFEGERLHVDADDHRHTFLLDPRRGWLRALPGATDATLVTRCGHRVVVRFDTADQAHDFLVAAGVARAHRCLQWPLADAGDWSPTLRLRARLGRAHLPPPLVVTLAIALVVALHVVREPALLAMSSGFVAAIFLAASGSLVVTMARLRRPPFVSVGDDGIAIEGLGTKRFIPLSALSRVEASDDGVLIHRDGSPRPLTLPLARHDPSPWLARHDQRELADPDEQLAMRDALMDRLRAALETRHAEPTPRALPDSDDAPTTAEAARRLRPSYRQPSSSPTELAALIASSHGTPAQRLAAATALAAEPDRRRDLRLALDSCADPELTTAIEALLATPVHAKDVAHRDEFAPLHAEASPSRR